MLSCYSVNGVTSAEDKALLRAALTSFTPDESLRWTTEQRFQYEIDCLEHGTGVELTLLSGARELGSCRNDFAISGGLCPLDQYTMILMPSSCARLNIRSKSSIVPNSVMIA